MTDFCLNRYETVAPDPRARGSACHHSPGPASRTLARTCVASCCDLLFIACSICLTFGSDSVCFLHVLTVVLFICVCFAVAWTPTGVCEKEIDFMQASAQQNSSRNSSPAPDLVFVELSVQRVLFSGRVFFTDNGMGWLCIINVAYMYYMCTMYIFLLSGVFLFTDTGISDSAGGPGGRMI